MPPAFLRPIFFSWYSKVTGDILQVCSVSMNYCHMNQQKQRDKKFDKEEVCCIWQALCWITPNKAQSQLVSPLPRCIMMGVR